MRTQMLKESADVLALVDAKPLRGEYFPYRHLGPFGKKIWLWIPRPRLVGFGVLGISGEWLHSSEFRVCTVLNLLLRTACGFGI